MINSGLSWLRRGSLALAVFGLLSTVGVQAEETKPVATATAPVTADAPKAEAPKEAPKAEEKKGPRDPSLEERVGDLETFVLTSTAVSVTDRTTKTAGQVNTGDNAWMLVSAALVLFMTAPGLALFYGGLVRRKNVLSTMMHSTFLMALVSVMWAVYGYSFSFGGEFDPAGTMSRYFGSATQFAMMKDVGQAPNGDYAGTIPHQTFMLFQLMFAIITPALISGAFAERVKFSAMVVFTVLWSTIIYFPLAHMVWGKGGLFNWWFAAPIPALDFAGGTVVHISSGVSALIFCLVLGKRKGYPTTPMMPHNLVLSMIGATMLWVGWFGFNAGSALFAGGLASQAFMNTHFAAATAGLVWAMLEWVIKGKPSALGTISGIVAGLVAITPAAGFVTAGSSLIIGAVVAIVCFIAVTKIKIALGYDDALDAFGVHGVGGTVGAIMTGLLADPTVNPFLSSVYKPIGADGKQVADAVTLTGGMGQVVNQVKAVGLTMIMAAVGTFIILKIVDAVIGLRPTEQEETEGLDVTQHGEEAYT